MTISPVREIIILSASFLSGCIIGIIYDILKRIKKHLGFNSLLLDIGDVITFILLSLCAYISVYIINDGKVRWYEIFGIFSGFFMYMSYLSCFVVKLLIFAEGAAGCLFGVLRRLIKPLFMLILYLSSLIKRVYRRLISAFFSRKRKKFITFNKIKCIFRKI